MADDVVLDQDVGADEAEVVPEPELLHGAPVTWPGGQQVLHPDRAELATLVRTLRDDDAYNMCLDVTGIDYSAYGPPRVLPDGVEPERFEVVVTLMSHEHRRRVRIRVQVPEGDPTCPTLFEVHPGSEAMEREVFDMFGISFEGHPDLTRILMPEDWVGHPLRKDEAVGRIPVQFKGPQDAR
ncbi:MAG: NADH-quinone oxidoreductase subunit C [Acidimicrobiales bacterium]